MKKSVLYIILFFQTFCYGQDLDNNKYKILVGSPVYQKPKILKEFLDSLERLKKNSYTLDYFFIDDNEIEEASNLLKDFKSKMESNCFILCSKKDLKFLCDAKQHYWTNNLIKKVAAFKDQMIQKAIEGNYDYLFLIDSDIVLHPKTIEQLLKAKKDIISNINWTKTANGLGALPQVWVSDEYTLFKHEIGEKITDEEKKKRKNEFFNMLLNPGTYEVGGLCACTLISKKALNKGVSFKEINNLTMFGEDRHFCIRAVVLGHSLFVDTHYPAFHIYRDSDLIGLEDLKKRNKGVFSKID